jgi:hypothetical protein
MMEVREKKRKAMFDDVSGMAVHCAEIFRDGVRDSFGASIAVDVLDVILKEIDSLRVLGEDFQRQILDIDRVLEDARTIQAKDDGHET